MILACHFGSFGAQFVELGGHEPVRRVAGAPVEHGDDFAGRIAVGTARERRSTAIVCDRYCRAAAVWSIKASQSSGFEKFGRECLVGFDDVGLIDFRHYFFFGLGFRFRLFGIFFPAFVVFELSSYSYSSGTGPPVASSASVSPTLMRRA
jgi:hypothetical protein